jgi:hypothetical protein
MTLQTPTTPGWKTGTAPASITQLTAEQLGILYPTYYRTACYRTGRAPIACFLQDSSAEQTPIFTRLLLDSSGSYHPGYCRTNILCLATAGQPRCPVNGLISFPVLLFCGGQKIRKDFSRSLLWRIPFGLGLTASLVSQFFSRKFCGKWDSLLAKISVRVSRVLRVSQEGKNAIYC